MIAVVHFDEGFDLASLVLFLLSHTLCNFLGVSGNSNYESMTIGAFAGSLFLTLDDNCFSSSISSVEHQHYLTGLYNTAHPTIDNWLVNNTYIDDFCLSIELIG